MCRVIKTLFQHFVHNQQPFFVVRELVFNHYSRLAQFDCQFQRQIFGKKFVVRVDEIASIFLTFDTSSFLVFHHLLPFQAELIRCKDRSLSVCRPRNHPWFRPSGRRHPCRKIHSFAIQAFLRNWKKKNRQFKAIVSHYIRLANMYYVFTYVVRGLFHRLPFSI